MWSLGPPLRVWRKCKDTVLTRSGNSSTQLQIPYSSPNEPATPAVGSGQNTHTDIYRQYAGVAGSVICAKTAHCNPAWTDSRAMSSKILTDPTFLLRYSHDQPHHAMCSQKKTGEWEWESTVDCSSQFVWQCYYITVCMCMYGTVNAETVTQ